MTEQQNDAALARERCGAETFAAIRPATGPEVPGPAPKTLEEVQDLFAQCFGQYVTGPAQLVHGMTNDPQTIAEIRRMRAEKSPAAPMGRMYRNRFVYMGSSTGARVLSRNDYRKMRTAMQLPESVLAFNLSTVGGTIIPQDVTMDVVMHEFIHGWTNGLFMNWGSQYYGTDYSGRPLLEAATQYMFFKTHMPQQVQLLYDSGARYLQGLGLTETLLERAMFGGQIQPLERELLAKTGAAHISQVFWGFLSLQRNNTFALPPRQ